MYLGSQTTTSKALYLQSFPCILKRIQLICNTIITAIVVSRWRGDAQHMSYLTASIGSLVFCSIIVFIKFRNIDKNMNNIPWTKLELGYYITWSLYYLILVPITGSVSLKIAEIFSLICVITFVIDASICYNEIKNEKYAYESNLNQQNEDLKNLNSFIV
nr:uncharacterized protein LOC111413235 [Onthophagus taurus]XP_022899900.1 uncharacterized protein LOC111413235 [Onthophagus taurus]